MAPPDGGHGSDDRGFAPHRGTAVLVLGIVGIVVCFICGIIAWATGAGDLRAMREGRMDPSGEGATRAGMICGIIAWSMGASDLREMREGRMDRRQESETRIGMILGIISTCLAALGLLFAILVFAGVIALGGKMLDESKPGGFFDRMGQAMEKAAARAELARIAGALEAHRARTGEVPGSLADLNEPLSRDDLRDPWNHAYEYVPLGTGRYRLYSVGPDGREATDDDILHVPSAAGPERDR